MSLNMIIAEKGLDGIIRGMDDFEKKQVPFALSQTVNALGRQTQRDTVDRILPEKFILRNDWWRPGRKTGVNYFPSHKKQYPNIQSKANTLAWFMELQETGGTKRPRSGDPYVAIPTWNAQPTKHEVIRPNRRYRNLAKGRMTLKHKGNPWISTLKNGKPSVAVRLTSARLPIAVMYIGRDSVTIKPRFGFRENGMAIGEKNGKAIMDKNLTNALATAKIK